MNINVIEENNIKIAVIESSEIIVQDVQSAIDFIATVRHTTPCDCIMIGKIAFGEEFFDLKTGLAGDVLQKFVNYRMYLAIIGDFSIYTSSSLKSFIYECNNGNHIRLVKSEKEALEFFTLSAFKMNRLKEKNAEKK